MAVVSGAQLWGLGGEEVIWYSNKASLEFSSLIGLKFNYGANESLGTR